MRKLLLTPLFLTLLPLAGCEANDDAGDVAFVHQATQILLCRKPHGVAEVSALVNIAHTSRDNVLDALMAEPEFVDCWVPILADTMQVQREGEFAQKRECIDTPEFILDAQGLPCSDCTIKATKLADFLRNSDPTATQFVVNGAVKSWNLNDALRAAIMVDDLHVAWRPWLFAAAGRPWKLPNPSPDDIRDNYLSTLLNVRPDCVSCHSSTYSKTEAYPEWSQSGHYIGAEYRENAWDRTSGFGFDLHGAAFAVNGTMDAWFDGPFSHDQGADLYYCHCTGCHGNDGAEWPWVNEVCPQTHFVPTPGGPFAGYYEPIDGYAPKPHVDRAPVMSRDAIVSQILNGGGCMPEGTLDDNVACEIASLAGKTDDEKAGLVADYMQRKLGSYEHVGQFTNASQFNAGTATPWGMSSSCGFTWAPGTHTGASYSFGGDAFSSTDAAAVAQVLKNGIAALPSQTTYVSADTVVDPDIPLPPSREAGVAFLVAFNIADDILEQLSGGRGTVPNTLSRTQAQSDLLRAMVTELVVNSGGQVRLSLKNMLKVALRSTLFNRHDPAHMAPDSWEPNNPGPYQMETYVNPWAATPYGGDVTKGDDRNGQGDLVHRRSPVELLWSLHHDLGWPAPAVDPINGAYPSHDFMDVQLGRYRSVKFPGATVWQLDSLLFWENKVGLCQNMNPAGTADYIDLLTDDAIANHAQATIRDVALVLKDRLLQEPQFTTLNGTSEETLVKQIFEAVIGTGNFSSQVGTYYNNNTTRRTKIAKALRQYCGAILVSPAYVMANLPTVTSAATAAPWTLCLDGEPCATCRPSGTQSCATTAFQDHHCAPVTALGRTCP